MPVRNVLSSNSNPIRTLLAAHPSWTNVWWERCSTADLAKIAGDDSYGAPLAPL
jgi:hypothetical protein